MAREFDLGPDSAASHIIEHGNGDLKVPDAEGSLPHRRAVLEKLCGMIRLGRYPAESVSGHILFEDDVRSVGPSLFRNASRLGGGGFGEVYRVRHGRTGKPFAMKVLRKRSALAEGGLAFAVAERNLLSRVRHPFVVTLHYAFQTSTSLVLVLQLCPNGDLKALLECQDHLPECLARFYLGEIFLAIEHLHARGIVFCDLKPANVVLDEGRHAMLTDFGLAKEGVDRFSGMHSFCGSYAHISPEILVGDGYGLACDVYGLGVLLFEMLAGYPPFYSDDQKQLLHNVQRLALKAPSLASACAADFIYATMSRCPRARLGAHDTSQLRSHSFLSSLDFYLVLRREVSPPFSDSDAAERGGCHSSQMEGSTAKTWDPFLFDWFASWLPARQVEGWEFVSAEDAASERACPKSSTSRQPRCCRQRCPRRSA